MSTPKPLIKGWRSLPNYGSHLPALIKCLSITDGPVLEMGTGFNSTPVMHWMCASKKRRLLSLENEPTQHAQFAYFGNEWHEVALVSDWDAAPIEQPWDVALIDHHPGERRKFDAKRLAPFAKYVILHDCDGRDDHKYLYSQIYPFFKWRAHYGLYRPQTMVLSNSVDLTGFQPWL